MVTPVLVTALLGLSAAALMGAGSERIASRLVQLMRDGSAAGRQPGRRPRGLPLPREIARLFLRARRLSDGLHRRTARQHLQLESAKRRSARAKQALDECERSAREKHLALSSAQSRVVTIDARWRAFLDTVPDVLIVADDSGRIEFANAAIHPLLAWTPEKLIGTPVRDDAFPAAEPPDPSPREIETRVRDSRGAFRELSARTQNFCVHGERRVGIRLRDVSGLRFLVQELQETRRAAGTTQRTRDQFVATMSHEIRTPLHGLMATLDMLRSEDFTADGRHRLAIARTSAKTLLNIANDIVDLSRINVGRMSLDRKPISLERLIAEVADEARARAEAAHLTVQTRITGQLPSSVIGDPVRIKQILRNLLANALKFTSHGGVTVQAGYAGTECSIDVADTGEGVPEDRRASIFEPFVQGDSASSRRFGGAGLGLAISRKLSETMGGSLTLLHTGKSGSTFRLTLPLPSSTEAPIEEQSQRVLRLVQGRILVIEDDEASRYVAQTLLESLQCPARIASSGHEALELIRSGEFDLVLMDCEMPEMDGFETTTRIRQMLDQHIPIVAMTASTTTADRQRCFDAGMDDVLPKPFNKSTLSEMLGKWLSDGDQPGPNAPLTERIASLAILDTGVFDELRKSLRGQNLPLRKMYDTFYEGARETIDILGAADPSPDRETVRRRLHSLQGSAGLFGARQIEHLAARLTQALEEEKRQELRDALPLLRDSLRRFERELEDRIRAVSQR
jgi:PAS domain S-box-containing protein